MTDKIITELQSLAPDATIELFELEIEGATTVYRFHAGTNGFGGPIAFGFDSEGEDIVYTPFPIEASGFDKTSEGTLPRPILKVSNILGIISALASDYDDLLGSKVSRIRTFRKFLNSSNFLLGNAQQDPTAKFPTEFYLVERKSAETRYTVEFELAVPWDMQGVKIPKRQILSNLCAFTYRGEGCSYSGIPIADERDVFIIDQDTINSGNGPWVSALQPLDKCGKRLSSCRLRFYNNPTDDNNRTLDIQVLEIRDNVLNFGGFPSAGRIK